MAKNTSNNKTASTSLGKGELVLPTPIELARIAAILQPDPLKATFAPKHGLARAMEFYLDAVDLLSEMPVDFETLVERFGSSSLKRKLRNKEARRLEPIFAKERKRILTMGPQSQASGDEVLRYLRSGGLEIETTKAVRELLKRWHDRLPAEIPLNMRIPDEWRRGTSVDFIAQFKQPRWRYQFPELLLTRALRYAGWTKKESRRKTAETKRNRVPVKSSQANISEKS